MNAAERRPAVAEYLRRNGPAHAADIVRAVPVPRGSVYRVLRSPEFQQLPDSRWTLALPGGGPSGCWPQGAAAAKPKIP